MLGVVTLVEPDTQLHDAIREAYQHDDFFNDIGDNADNRGRFMVLHQGRLQAALHARG
jgi:hypothetical protein